MSNVQNFPTHLRGLSFSIAELTLIDGWAEARGLVMVVRLDLASATQEYEEVIALHPERRQPCRWMMWRDTEAVFVRPLVGRTRRHGSVAEAIESLTPLHDGVVTDVMAPRWPDRGFLQDP
jgi:hypothetical protein